MKIAYIASYTPRQCGIATFTNNKFNAVNSISGNNNAHEGIVIAMNDRETEYDYPDEVKLTISQNKAEDYIKAAEYLNNHDVDLCILEHEFGIFGGRDGSYILSLLHRLKMPVISVLHTVLKSPSYNQRAVTREISSLSAKTVVMSQKAVEFLTQVYGISNEEIEIIDHGIPNFEFNHQMAKKEFGLENKNVLLTFGLISRNKGIETVLKSLPEVIAKHPETVYLVLGKTHPAVVRHSGEEYRDYLKALSAELLISDHVIFLDEFTDEKRLFKYLSAADIYITPYLNEAQITSGTLSYAVGAGCAVISTPYWHAAELLTPERGRLFNFNDSEKLTECLLELLDNPTLMAGLRKNSRAYGREVTWPKIAEKYITLGNLMIRQHRHMTQNDINIDLEELPPFALDHIRRMTDSTGLFQHAKFGIPNLKEGYCLDDNARALLMVMMAYKQKKHLHATELLPVYLGYIHYMQNEDGSFRNFLSFSRNFLDEVGSEDSFGRTIWALGYLLGNTGNSSHSQYCKEIFLKAVPHFEKLKYIRGISNTMIGLSIYLERNPNDMAILAQLQMLADKLTDAYKKHSDGNWKWFESSLTYDNAVMPLALLHAAEILQDDELMALAIDTMDFVSSVTLNKGYLSVVGNEKWFAKNEEQSVFAQQPIDVMMMVLMFQKAYQLTKDETYMNNMQTAFTWFLGNNDLHMHLYDKDSKGCRDGLESYGANQNQGAESTLAYLISHLAVSEIQEVNAREEVERTGMQNFSGNNTGIAV